MDLPGIDVGDVEAVIAGDTLTIRGRRTYPYDGVEDHALRSIERGFGTFERRLDVPEGLNPAAVDATLTGGVLTLRVPRPGAPAQRGRRAAPVGGAAR